MLPAGGRCKPIAPSGWPGRRPHGTYVHHTGSEAVAAGCNIGSTAGPPGSAAQNGILAHMAFQPGSLDGVWVFKARTHANERGFFHEAFRMSELQDALGRLPSFV